MFQTTNQYVKLASSVSTIEKVIRLILPTISHCPLSLGVVSPSKPKHSPFLQKNMLYKWSTSALNIGTLFQQTTWISYQTRSIPIVVSVFPTSIPMIDDQSLSFQVTFWGWLDHHFSLSNHHFCRYFWTGARPFCSNGLGNVQVCYCAPLPSSWLSPDSSVMYHSI